MNTTPQIPNDIQSPFVPVNSTNEYVYVHHASFRQGEGCMDPEAMKRMLHEVLLYQDYNTSHNSKGKVEFNKVYKRLKCRHPKCKSKGILYLTKNYMIMYGDNQHDYSHHIGNDEFPSKGLSLNWKVYVDTNCHHSLDWIIQSRGEVIPWPPNMTIHQLKAMIGSRQQHAKKVHSEIYGCKASDMFSLKQCKKILDEHKIDYEKLSSMSMDEQQDIFCREVTIQYMQNIRVVYHDVGNDDGKWTKIAFIGPTALKVRKNISQLKLFFGELQFEADATHDLLKDIDMQFAVVGISDSHRQFFPLSMVLFLVKILKI